MTRLELMEAICDGLTDEELTEIHEAEITLDEALCAMEELEEIYENAPVYIHSRERYPLQ